MKTRFFLITFAVLLASSLVSCEMADSENLADEVTFTVEVPDMMATKAISDGKSVTHVHWACFTGGTANTPISGLNGREALKESQGKMTAAITVNLVKNVPYKFVFWAQVDNEQGKNDAYDLNGFVSEGKVKVSYKGNANDEDRDAFYAMKEYTFTPGNVTIPLTRPFAQINFLAADYSVVTAAGISKIESTVSIEGIPNVLDCLTGVVSVDGTVKTDLEYTAAPSDPATYTSYGWYSMNYILAAAAKTDNLVVIGKFKHDKSDEEIAITVNNVPYQRNYRTNIIGNFLTEQAVLNIEVDPNFTDKDNDGEYSDDDYIHNYPEDN